MNTVRQYSADENGTRMSVILPRAEYRQHREDLSDLGTAVSRQNEGTIPLTALKTNMGFKKNRVEQ
jgi:hypothetical protein